MLSAGTITYLRIPSLNSAITMLILVINLDRAPERLAHMRSEFGRIGCEFTRLAATDGRELDAADSMNALEGRRMSKGEIACFVSHRRCWQSLLDSEHSHAVVLEDDMFLGEGAERFFRSADWFPEEAGIVKLETYMSPSTIATKPAMRFGDRALHKLTGKHLGAGAYALDRATAQMLVDASAVIDRQVDDFLFGPKGPMFARARIHQMVPALCIQGLKLGSRASECASQLYEERLTTRAKLGPLRKVRREIVSGFRKSLIAVRGSVQNLLGTSHWGRIPFR
ncbi:glycosyltransferase family 25 protein [Aliihoeflea sp. PC F10.4]